MIKGIISTILTIGIVFIGAVNISIAEGTCPYGSGDQHGEDSSAIDEVINTVCPVMGGAVSKDTPIKIVYNGKTIGFCCAGCVAKFKTDPEKYMAKIAESAKATE